MKTAICLSGLTRHYERSLESLKAFIPEADIFAHTYEITDISSIVSDSWSKDTTLHYYRDKNDSESEILAYYNPKIAKIDNYEHIRPYFEMIFKACKLNEGMNLSPISMFYSINAANELKSQYERDNHFKYDIVYRLRYDSLIEERIPALDLTYLNIPLAQDVMVTCKESGFTDQVAIGPSYLIDFYSNLFNHLQEYALKTGRLFPEELLKEHLEPVSHLIKRPKVSISIMRGRAWLRDMPEHISGDLMLPSYKEAISYLPSAKFHFEDSIYLDEVGQYLDVVFTSGATYWPNIPDSCQPFLKACIRIELGDEWRVVSHYCHETKYLTFLEHYVVALAQDREKRIS